MDPKIEKGITQIFNNFSLYHSQVQECQTLSEQFWIEWFALKANKKAYSVIN